MFDLPFDPFELLKALIEPIVLIVIAPFIIKRLVSPTDLQRAEVIERVANDLVNQVVAENPNSQPALLVQQFIRRLSEAVPASVRTSNQAVYQRVAISKLAERGFSVK